MAIDVYAGLYSTDEHLAIKLLGDYPRLAPDSQRYAHGLDGRLSGWELASLSVGDFDAAGVCPGMCVRLATGALVQDDILVVSGVAGPTLTLRRAGGLPGSGALPAPAGATNAQFAVLCCAPQILAAHRKLAGCYTPPDGVSAEELARAALAESALAALELLGSSHRGVAGASYEGGGASRPSGSGGDNLQARHSQIRRELAWLLDGLGDCAAKLIASDTAEPPPAPGRPAAVGSMRARSDWVPPAGLGRREDWWPGYRGG